MFVFNNVLNDTGKSFITSPNKLFHISERFKKYDLSLILFRLVLGVHKRFRLTDCNCLVGMKGRIRFEGKRDKDLILACTGNKWWQIVILV